MPSRPKTSIWTLSEHWKSLTQVPSSHLRPVDGIRAISIIVVFLFHCVWCSQLVLRNAYEEFLELPALLQWTKRGSLGVELFFVISGFLIGRLLFLEYQARQTLNLKRFFARRFFRLMPAYWFALGTAAIGVLVAPTPERIFDRELSSNLGNIWTNLLYINNFWPAKEQFLSHSWSLAVEEQFYVLWPLLMVFGIRRGWHQRPLIACLLFVGSYFGIRALAALHALDVMATTCGGNQHEVLNGVLNANLQIFVSPFHDCIAALEFDVLYDNLYTRFLGFGIGIYGAHLYVSHREDLQSFFRVQRRRQLLTLLSLFSVSFPFIDFMVLKDDSLLFLSSRFLSHLLLGLGAIYLILCTLSRDTHDSLIGRLLSARWLFPIAQLSYSLYLFHILVIMGVYQVLIRLIPDLSLSELIAMGAPIAWFLSLLVSMGVYLFIERPGIAMRKRLAP